MNRILVTGAGGQIGSSLLPVLRERYGASRVLATDVRLLGSEIAESGPFQLLDATDAMAVGQAVIRHDADTVYHLAAILSAVGERDPRFAWHVNMASLQSVLDVAREQKCAVFMPSSIGVFGPDTPKDRTPQDTLMRPAESSTRPATSWRAESWSQRKRRRSRAESSGGSTSCSPRSVTRPLPRENGLSRASDRPPRAGAHRRTRNLNFRRRTLHAIFER